MQSFKRTLDSEPLEWEPLHASSVTRREAGKVWLGISWVQLALDCDY